MISHGILFHMETKELHKARQMLKVMTALLRSGRTCQKGDGVCEPQEPTARMRTSMASWTTKSLPPNGLTFSSGVQAELGSKTAVIKLPVIDPAYLRKTEMLGNWMSFTV